MEQNRALDVILGAMHEEIKKAQELCMEAQHNYLLMLEARTEEAIMNEIEMETEMVPAMDAYQIVFERNFMCTECKTLVDGKDRYCRRCGRKFKPYIRGQICGT